MPLIRRYEGDCFAVRLDSRTDAAPLVTILVEDDGNWFEKMSFDVHWAPELVELLQAAMPPHPQGKP